MWRQMLSKTANLGGGHYLAYAEEEFTPEIR